MKNATQNDRNTHFVYFYKKCTKHVQKMVLRNSTFFAFYFFQQNRACLVLATYNTGAEAKPSITGAAQAIAFSNLKKKKKTNNQERKQESTNQHKQRK